MTDNSGMPGFLTGIATYIMSVPIVALRRREVPIPNCLASTTSGRAL